MSLDFDDADLGAKVEALKPDERNALPFGAIRLDRNDVVKFFNRKEGELSGMGDRQQVGRNFFADIAPCLANDDYRGRIIRARAAGEVDIEMGVIGDFDDADGEMRARIVSAPNGGLWIFHEREIDRVDA